jgi:hypothetical protein
VPRRYVLVIVPIVLLLLCAGLLFPAIGRVRDAAARMACAGHFCQLGVALHSYASANQESFPPGTVPHPELPPEQRLSWLVPVLPYFEQDSVFKQFDLTFGSGDVRNAKPTSTRIRFLTCPASDECVRNNGGEVWKSPAPLTHYVGVAGIGSDAATLPLGHPRAGVFGYDRRTALKDGFPDGISNTLMLIETANNPGHWAYGGPATVRAFEPGTAPYIGEDRPFGGFHNSQLVLFGARTYKCNVGLADRAYRTFTNKTDPAVLEALATVAGKEELPANW